MGKNDATIKTPSGIPSLMTKQEFQAIGGFIQDKFGIRMPATKKAMLQSRLRKRLRAMNIYSYQEYQDYLFSPRGRKIEVPLMLNEVTTNKTEFFRESSHFDLLKQKILPAWMGQTGGQRTFSAWSAGCSSGEEPYSLGMTLSEFTRIQPDFDFQIIATDISEKVLHQARQAIYATDKADLIPLNLKKRYLLRSRDQEQELIRIAPELRNKITFNRLNLMDDFSPQTNYLPNQATNKIGDKKDIIFCRNVIIYFERPVQEELFNKCCDCLRPGGYLLIGHSESLSGLKLPLKQKYPTIYQKI